MSEQNGQRELFNRRELQMQANVSGFVQNEILGRAALFRRALCEPKRDIEGECGHPQTVTAEEFRDAYDRDPIAARVIEIFPDECWRAQPTVFEDDSSETSTPFEEAWDELARQLTGNSRYQQEGGSPVWEYLHRADVLSGIGHYGVILLGFDDGGDLREPVQPNEDRKLLFLRAFDESLAQISAFEQDPSSERYGKPKEYLLHFNDTVRENVTAYGVPLASFQVHWSRIIHVADNLMSSEIFGQPRLRPVWNRLCDLRKLYGGSAEMYWKGAFPGISIESHPQLGGDVEFDPDEMKGQMEDYDEGLKRWLAFAGFSAKSLSPQVSDPTAQIERQLEAISIRMGIPKRIFMGSERGELSSSQDSGEWANRVMARQSGYVIPRVIVPFVDRLIQAGVLPEPEGYSVTWEPIDNATEEQKAEVAAQRTAAMAQYVSGGVESIMAPMDYLTKIIGMEEDEAEAVVEAAEQNMPIPPDPMGGGEQQMQLPFPEVAANRLNWNQGGDNCGTGYGGFEHGNDCAAGDGGGSVDAPSTPSGLKTEFSDSFSQVDSSKSNFKRGAKAMTGADSVEDVGAVLGVQSNSDVYVSASSPDHIRMEFIKSGGQIKGERSLLRDANGLPYIVNKDFRIAKPLRQSGVGTAIFHEQVKSASAAGIDRIETFAAGGPGQADNGYYTWPRLGYDADVSSLSDGMQSKIRNSGFRANRVSDLMKTREGREFWKNEGEAFKGVFDLKDGSLSRKVLSEYAKRKRQS